ncbi:type II secretion system protein [Bacillus sp. FJAT-47783]|uniref:type IV pilus modification PilV family protein n=1 Tax=Bacillus sp. FJAT-47783 TaxID=2922712 RepID=UPI001FADB32C|nr:type II secretion system protein [Bacillus sp. FJAT-47783]
MINWKFDESGVTLVELVASITILFIVLSVFATFFTQSALFTKKNEEAISAVNLARLVLEEVRENHSVIPFKTAEYETFNKGDTPHISYVTEDGTFLANEKLRLKLFVEVVTDKQNGESMNLGAYKITIYIVNKKGEIVTDTYGLIEVTS